MEILGKASLYVHILAGTLTLLAGPVAILYNFKDKQKHKIAGKIFFYAMLVVTVTAWVGYLKRPDVVFFQFLLGISMIVLAGILRGVRSIRFMKGAAIRWYDHFYTLMLALFGIWMVYKSVWHFNAGTMIAFPILFGVFGLGAINDARRNWMLFDQGESVPAQTWYLLHVSTMLGAFTAATTAFTVNAAHFLPWYLQWFGPTLLIVPLQIYFGRKLRKKPAAVPSGVAAQQVELVK
ncbi:MAG: hypothetical protein IPL65_14075 [Lewinellaceae bacterium]|nr:hypothetical protein [Lewinellaceae bacterium]